MAISLIETASLDTGLVAPTATALTTASGSAPSYSARAWVNFNGTGTVAIRASGNVSSITDNGTGDYTVNFTTAMADANYASFGFGKQGTGTTLGGAGIEGTSPSTGSLRILTADASFNAADFVFVSVSIFR
jgi:hypothetical protein